MSNELQLKKVKNENRKKLLMGKLIEKRST